MDLRELISQMSSFPAEVLDQMTTEELECAFDFEQRFHETVIDIMTDDEKEFPLFVQPTMALIRERTGLEGPFRVFYQDQDGDKVQVETDVEFEEMMEVAKEMLPYGGSFQVVVTQKEDDDESDDESESESESESEDEIEDESEDEEDVYESVPVFEEEQYCSKEMYPQIYEREPCEEVKKEEVKEEKVEEKKEDEFELPDLFKAKVLEVEGMLEDMGCDGVSRKRVIEVLFEEDWKVSEPLITKLLNERAKIMEERKEKAKQQVMAFLAAKNDVIFERVAEVMGEDGDALAAFGEVFAQEVAKQ